MMKSLTPLIAWIFCFTSVSGEPEESIDDKQRVAIELVEILTPAAPDEAAIKKNFAGKIDGVIEKLQLNEQDAKRFRQSATGAIESVTHGHLMGLLGEAYVRRFTLKELQEIVAFYRSPAGKAWLREQPSLEKERSSQAELVAAAIAQETKRRFDAGEIPEGGPGPDPAE